MSKILYSIAKDQEGNWINASDAEKGQKFSCLVCGDELVLRKSGREGPGSKRPHFAHKADTPNCSPETALHFAFKTLLAERLRRGIKLRSKLIFSWVCQYCHVSHFSELLERARTVVLEYNMGICKPDLAILDENGVVFAVIEVVVTHQPEKTVKEYYKQNNIILIQFSLKSDLELNNFDERVTCPDMVNYCQNPKCSRAQTKLSF